ncbi:hypothetical protein ANCDUO_21626 [Ancylostoma duodenale]|uniref:Uncharacterized protein n=1 Tax=Ancylostoma duodenale TaxID=51022 RepID=A0A0C2FTT4_9BILA|nr:hypothetical protein ANCDUO_21626 [Ancylostoma duodenale]
MSSVLPQWVLVLHDLISLAWVSDRIINVRKVFYVLMDAMYEQKRRMQRLEDQLGDGEDHGSYG